MVGNRGSPKQPMRRTTSLTEFSPPDVLAGVAEEEEEGAEGEREDQEGEAPYGWLHVAGRDWLAACRARAAPALAAHRRNSADFSAAETAAFLRACGLCRRRLGPGRDTFMYRGDTAFCSLECRQQHITREEWKEKCALAPPPPPVGDQVAPASGGSEKSGTGGTLAAA